MHIMTASMRNASSILPLVSTPPPPTPLPLLLLPLLLPLHAQLLTNTAAALPAELPKRGEAAAVAAAAAQGPKWGLVSKEEQQYQRRVAAQRSQGNQ